MIVFKSADLSRLHQCMNRYVTELKMSSRAVVRQQMGLLQKALVDQSPPFDRKESMSRIRNRVATRFQLAQEAKFNVGRENAGATVNWYNANKGFLFGVAPDRDMRNASAAELFDLYPKLTKTGRQSLTFRHPRKKQRVVLSQRILARRSTVRQVQRLASDTLGRLKAGWAVGWTEISPGRRPPPRWIMRHVNDGKNRGVLISGLSNPRGPTLAIINRSSGVASPQSMSIIARACSQRVFAMERDIANQLRGVYRRAGFKNAK